MRMKPTDQPSPKLEMLKRSEYLTLPETDPLIFYYLPFFGPLYRARVEMALGECKGGQRVLEVGYGSGVAFLNLAKKYQEIHGIDLFADPEQVMRMWHSKGLTTYLKKGNLLSLPYENEYFDAIVLISILEHIKPEEQQPAMAELHRVLKPGGQLIYGVPVERPLMVRAYGMLGYDIRQHHFSTEHDVASAAESQFHRVRVQQLKSPLPFIGAVYEVGSFEKTADVSK